MFIGISKTLPETSYIKLIDIWLIFNLLIPFGQVLLHTGADVLRNKAIMDKTVVPSLQQAWKGGDDDEPLSVKEKLLKLTVGFGMLGFPLIFFLFCVGFMIVGLHLKSVEADKVLEGA